MEIKRFLLLWLQKDSVINHMEHMEMAKKKDEKEKEEEDEDEEMRKMGKMKENLTNVKKGHFVIELKVHMVK